MSRLSDFVELLKQHLKDHQSEFIDRNSWVGDTESGFHTEYSFDKDKLDAEIDKFAAWFQGPRDTPAPEPFSK